MGSPVSVAISNLVMEDVEERALATTDIPSGSAVHRLQELLDHLNGVEPNIQCTVKTQSEGMLPFLNVLLQQDPDGIVLTTVYRNPLTQLRNFINVASHHPIAHKAAVVQTLLSRAEAISSLVVARDK